MICGVILAIAARNGDSCNNTPMSGCSSKRRAREWSFAAFVQTWPGTFCSDNCCKTSDTLSKEGFTIHGLWPNFQQTPNSPKRNYPFCCSGPNAIEGSQVAQMIAANPSVQKDVDTYWPALKRPGFIEYEWDKHGTCASSVYANPLDFIKAAINLRKRFDLMPVLLEHGIIPSDTKSYRRSDIMRALEAVTQTNVILRCVNDGQDLAEVWTCIKRDNPTTTEPEAFDCDPLFIKSSANCGDSIRLPVLDSSSLSNDEGSHNFEDPLDDNDIIPSESFGSV